MDQRDWTVAPKRRTLLALPIAAVLSGCDSRPRITFIGDGAAEQFEPWRKFRAAWAAHHPQSLQAAGLDYLACPLGQVKAKNAAIRAAADSRPAALVAPTGNSARMTIAASAGIPVIFASFLDPIRAGFARSDRVPGGHATGISLADWLDAKRLQILREAFPGIRRVGVLTDRSWAEHYLGEQRVLNDARMLGLEVTMYYAVTADDIDRLMGNPAAAREDAWYAMPTNLAYVGEKSIAMHLQRLKAPGMFSTIGEVQRGGAIAYVADGSFVYPKLAELVARVVNGEDPGRIPIERPRRFMLVARADAHWRGEPISARLLRRADHIV
jgi:putative tryptophan/tyrosine transport system substrate-binding protein